MSKVAVVTGSNKGIGFAIVKGLCQKYDGVVYLTSRDEVRGKEAVAKLNKLGLTPEYYQLDVSDRNSVEIFKKHIESKHGGLDILINNAAVTDNTLSPSSYKESKKVIDINFGGVITMREIIYPLVRKNGRILNLSSCCGHLSNLKNQYWIERLTKKDLTIKDIQEFINWFLDAKKNGTFDPEDFVDGGTVPAYRVSKIALNAVTKIHQNEFEANNISINSMHPGLVRTDMTTCLGFYSIDQAAATPLYLVLDAPPSIKGEFIWYDRRILNWSDYKADYYFRLKSLVEENIVLF